MRSSASHRKLRLSDSITILRIRKPNASGKRRRKTSAWFSSKSSRLARPPPSRSTAFQRRLDAPCRQHEVRRLRGRQLLARLRGDAVLECIQDSAYAEGLSCLHLGRGILQELGRV